MFYANTQCARVSDGAVEATGTFARLIAPSSPLSSGVDEGVAKARWGIYPLSVHEETSTQKTSRSAATYSSGDDKVYVTELVDKSLAELKTDKAAAAQAKAQALIDAGFIYAIPGESPADERTYSISDTMQAHMMAIYNRIKGGGSGPMEGVWPDATDSDREFSDAEWTAFAEAASEYKEGILRNLRVFLRNVRASANGTQLDNCVVSTGVTTGFDDDASGWPTNGS